MVKILHPIPNTCPSARYSIADAATELANPVMVKSCQDDTDEDQKQGTPASGSFFVCAHGRKDVQKNLPQNTDKTAGHKCFKHIQREIMDRSDAFDVFGIGLLLFILFCFWHFFHPFAFFLMRQKYL